MRPLRVLGHPLHPPLVHLPFGLLLAVPVLMGVGRLWEPSWSQAARVVLDLGLVASIPTLLTGLLDLSALRPGDRAMSAAFVHLSAMGSALCAYAMAWAVWEREGTALIFAIVGASALLIGGAAGGHLVYVHGVSVRQEDPD